MSTLREEPDFDYFYHLVPDSSSAGNELFSWEQPPQLVPPRISEKKREDYIALQRSQIEKLAYSVGIEQADLKLILVNGQKVSQLVRSEVSKLIQDEPNGIGVFTFTALQQPAEVLNGVYSGLIENRSDISESRKFTFRALIKNHLDQMRDSSKIDVQSSAVQKLLREIRGNMIVALLDFKPQSRYQNDAMKRANELGLVDGIVSMQSNSEKNVLKSENEFSKIINSHPSAKAFLKLKAKKKKKTLK